MKSEVVAIAEHRQGELRDVSFELITAGRTLADDLGGALHVVVIDGSESFTADLNIDGVDTIHTVDVDAQNGESGEFNHDIYTQVTSQLYEELSPTVLLLPNTVNGLDYAPAVAQAIQTPIVTDAIGLSVADGTLSVTREMYGSKVETDVAVDIEGQDSVVTVRPAEWEAAGDGDADADLNAFEAEIDSDSVRSTVTGFDEVASGDVDISEAEFLVSIGRGIEEEENLPLIEELVEVTGATLSSSRPIVDSGWLPKNRQVGQSGKVVTPDVYLAIGISGAVQHVAGMKGSDTIIAINTDPNAPIMDLADYAIVDDLFDVVPALIETFEQ